MFATVAPTLALAGLGLATPACCCGGPAPPSPGPPGSISGEVLFASRMTPSPVAVYAVEGSRYAMTKVTPPARTYQLAVPPGTYQVVARLDSDPLSSAGYLTCVSGSCQPVMTRAGYVTCRSLDCQPVLTNVRVEASQEVDHIDVGGWGSLYALDTLWALDEGGAPGPIAYVPPSPGARPSPQPQPALRQMPAPAPDVLPLEFGVPTDFDVKLIDARLHLPAGWRQIANPAEGVAQSIRRDFANQPVRSALALEADGVWLTAAVTGSCGTPRLVDATARAVVSTPNGSADFFFEDPHSSVGQQPYSGFAFMGIRPLAADLCLTFRFTSSSEQAREKNLPTFLAIVQQAEFVK